MFFIWYSKQTPSQDTNVCAARRLPSGVRPAARQEQSSLGRHGVPNYLYVSSLGAVRCCTHISRRAPCLKPGKGAQRACSEPSRSTRISKDFVWAPPRLVSCCLGRSVFVCLVGRHVYTRARSCRRLTGAFHKFSHVVILVKWTTLPSDIHSSTCLVSYREDSFDEICKRIHVASQSHPPWQHL